MHLVGFIIRIHHDARSSERQFSLQRLPEEVFTPCKYLRQLSTRWEQKEHAGLQVPSVVLLAFNKKGTFWQILEKPPSINFRENLSSRSPVVSCLQTEAAILVGGQQRSECAEYL